MSQLFVKFFFVITISIIMLNNFKTRAAKSKPSLIVKISDHKDFKKYVRTHTNVLVLFTKSGKDLSNKDLYEQVADLVRGKASVVHIDCSVDKKLCKKLKSSPSGLEVKHYKDGDYHKVYDRRFTVKSMVRFLENPKSEFPWSEEESALDIIHLETRQDLVTFLTKEKKPSLVMFYAPWCGYCKKLKPDFSSAASILKGESVLAAMDVDTDEGMFVRQEYNITGFPTIIFFKNGKKLFNYGGENNKDGIISWMKNPGPPKEPEKEADWSETETDVVHLTEETIEAALSIHSSVLVMFYAPWCGHCKKMKPEYELAAKELKTQNIDGVLAAVDTTKSKLLGEKFNISGFPTLKYFKYGKVEYDVNQRNADKIIEFMKDPKEPPPPPPEELPWEMTESHVQHLTGDDEGAFKSFIKKKKHCLIIFYAPWCGHCKKAKPEFMQAAEVLKEDSKVAFGAVDCIKNVKLCELNGVTGYPSFQYFNYGKNEQKYTGGREKKDFVDFMRNPSGVPPQTSSIDLDNPNKQPPKHWDDLESGNVIILLTDDTFEQFITENKAVLVTFYATTCKHCHEMRSAFIEAAKQIIEEKVHVKFVAVDAMVQKKLQKKYHITGMPTIKFFLNGEEHLDFEEARDKENFIKFAKNPSPKAVDWTTFPGPANIQHLNTGLDFKKQLLVDKWLPILFYLPSSPDSYYKARHVYWSAVSQLTDQSFAVINCDTNFEICQSEKVKSYPTLLVYINGVVDMQKFPGSTKGYNVDNLMAYFKELGLPSKQADIKTEL